MQRQASFCHRTMRWVDAEHPWLRITVAAKGRRDGGRQSDGGINGAWVKGLVGKWKWSILDSAVPRSSKAWLIAEFR